jgi:hypothetical protein
VPDPKKANEMVQELNRLEQQYGRVQHERDPNYDVPGEARARIQLLKDQLAKQGFSAIWDGSQYRLR